MSTPTARLGLLKPERPDQFLTSDIAANWAKVDQYPGSFICTSTTRPTWSTAQAGMWISETDTGLSWRWTGSAWARAYPLGRLKTTAGAWADAARTTAFSTTSQPAFVIALALSNVVVPDGNRPIEITAAWSLATNSTAGSFYATVFRSNTANSGTQLATPQLIHNAGGTYTWVDTVPVGTYSWSVQIRSANGGTSTINGLTMSVTEV